MALSTAECEKMILEAKKHGSKLCVVHNQLFLDSIQKAKAMVDSGNYDLTSFRTSLKGSYEWLMARNMARRWNVAPEEKGIIWEVGAHLAYLQLHFLPNIKEIYAVGGKVKYPVYDDFAVLLRTADDRYGIMEISWVTKEADLVYEVCSSNGKRLQIYGIFDFLLEKSKDFQDPDSISDVARNFYTDEKRIFGKWITFGMNFLRKRNALSHFKLIKSYIESLEKDSDPPVRPEAGRNTIRLLECIEESLNTHRAVAVTF
jgi:predicted dehydrogenase